MEMWKKEYKGESENKMNQSKGVWLVLLLSDYVSCCSPIKPYVITFMILPFMITFQIDWKLGKVKPCWSHPNEMWPTKFL